MITCELIVFGNVQGVGYRATVAEIAKRREVNGFVRNLPDGTVRIVAQCESKSKLEDFISSVSINDPPIKVTNLEKRFFDSDKKYDLFTISRDIAGSF